jgi:hypothetical protein
MTWGGSRWGLRAAEAYYPLESLNYLVYTAFYGTNKDEFGGSELDFDPKIHHPMETHSNFPS